jgi:hypothetical protein
MKTKSHFKILKFDHKQNKKQFVNNKRFKNDHQNETQLMIIVTADLNKKKLVRRKICFTSFITRVISRDIINLNVAMTTSTNRREKTEIDRHNSHVDDSKTREKKFSFVSVDNFRDFDK